MLSALLVLFATTVLAQTDPSDNPKGPGLQPALPPTGTAMVPTPFEPAEHVFARLDTGRRGFLTRDQVSSLERFPFDAADVNADSMLTVDEFARAWGPYNSKK